MPQGEAAAAQWLDVILLYSLGSPPRPPNPGARTWGGMSSDQARFPIHISCSVGGGEQEHDEEGGKVGVERWKHGTQRGRAGAVYVGMSCATDSHGQPAEGSAGEASSGV